MQITLAGEYAIRTMIYLAERKDESIAKISNISSENDIPEKFLRKIIPLLCNAGLLKTQRGIGGGISLNKPADQITPLQVVQAVEGEMVLNKCLIDKEFCSNTRWCTVHTLWCKALTSIKEILSSKSIEQLAIESAERKSKHVCSP